MKALTLTQPWASLVAIGAKRIETRCWRTNYRGPLAIRAAKGFPGWAKQTWREDPFDEVLRAAFGDGSWKQIDPPVLPLGCVIATCTLVSCTLTSQAYDERLSEQERAFGDYSLGRFAWVLEDIKPLSEPIPAKGALSLWEFTF